MGDFKIGIVGLGMVGEPLKKYFEIRGFKRGENLFCYDIDSKKNYDDDVNRANVVFICVPSPRNTDGSCNTVVVESVVKKYSSPDRIIVIKSTVEPTTCEKLAKKYKSPIIFNPEFLTESRAWEDMTNPDRQIVAYTNTSKTYTSLVLNLLPKAYFSAPGTLGTYKFVRINSTEAELGKYAGNIFGAMKVTFGNIFADICDGITKLYKKKKIKTSVDYTNVQMMLAHDRRIGDAWLDIFHGNYRGFGGYCFPKDLDALISFVNKLTGQLVKNSKDIILLKKGVKVLKDIREYNQTLLALQDYDIKDVSLHNHEIPKLLVEKDKHKTKKI